jgi:hypothetical protein
MSSELDDCLVELFDANDEACGTPQFVFVDGKKKRAIIEEITTEEIIVAGGNAESGGFRAKCRKAEFAEQPTQGTDIKKQNQDRALSILSVIERNGVEYEITAGDPTSEDQ